MAHIISSDTNDERGRGIDQQEEEYITLECSDPDSDVEIDLLTKPLSNKAVRKAPKVPKHFCKSNAKVYDNISVFAPPNSNLIFRCSQKRANWYLSRNLARQLSPTSIHLNFAPAGQGHVNDPYYLEERENKCVICGNSTEDAGATMLHVVPEQYRKWFPIRLKSHSSHDIVVACPGCNAQWDREAAVVRKKIVNIFKIPLEGLGWIRDHEAGVAKRSAGAVIAEWNRQWQVNRDQQQSTVDSARRNTGDTNSGIAATSKSEDCPVKLLDLHLTSEGSEEYGTIGQKKAKTKKQNVIPPQRLQTLEKLVYDWWENTHDAVVNSAERRLSQHKREIPVEFSNGPGGSQDSQKRQKSDDIEAVTQPPSSSLASLPKEDLPEIKVPSPPPGHSTELSRDILEAALNAQANYKGPGYKEHGQLVVARIMAASPEFHHDTEETQETIAAWQEAEPLHTAPEGMRSIEEFIRTWRREFLNRAKPNHLSTEWKVENPA
ncbi:hypothetical protein BGZ76_005926 [Entomortierella beljakovae]|nr:hypothetical protein BGZ76_005926 [Entomortierella beljakovae]